MTQEEKELLLKDLSARLPYGVIVSIKELDSDRKPWFGELSCKDLDCFIHDVAYESIKPYLRPMSSMTAEECKELGELSATIENVGETLPNTPYYIEVARPEQIDYLNACHFDYRGLIEKGLALEAPEGMYKEK